MNQINIALTGFKGGVAKTTTGLYLAKHFSTLGSTLFVDADRNRSAIGMRERATQPFPFAVMSNRESPKHEKNYEFIVRDLPGNPDEDDLVEVAKGSDLMVLPTVPDAMSYEAVLELGDALEGLHYKVLVTIAPPLPSKMGTDVRDRLRDGGLPVFETVIHRSTAFGKAAELGLLLDGTEYDQLFKEVQL